MRYLLILSVACLFFASCSCDEPYCPNIEETIIRINYSDDFTLSELRNSNLMIIDTVRQLTIDSFNLISTARTSRYTTIEYYYELPSMDNIFVLNFDNFSDTIRNFRYDTNETTYECNVGCIISDYATINLTEVNDFYFIYRGDTIRDKTVFIEK